MYIKRSLLLADILDYKVKYPNSLDLLNGFTQLVNKQPAQEVETVRYCHPTLKLGSYEYCSFCGKLTYLGNYCANCGAKVERGNHG